MKDRRRTQRRDSDRVLKETVEILKILEEISRGEEGDYSEHFADLVGLKDRLGRRKEDRRLGETLCSTLESLATNLQQLVKRRGDLRKVRITKVSGRKGARLGLQIVIVGWEEERPCVGKNYRLFKEDGGIFRSALVTRVTEDYFQTQNSLYRLEVLHES